MEAIVFFLKKSNSFEALHLQCIEIKVMKFLFDPREMEDSNRTSNQENSEAFGI